QEFHFIIFDTPPTPHTFTILQLPSPSTDYLNTTTNHPSSLPQLSPLNQNTLKYNSPLQKLPNQHHTTIMLLPTPT
ncbi:ArsA-related P-loop ATPase, partial [Staphylococcus epidermidis]|uniref:ArsA-related P-loop ATPase n=1 Tax=Staphylococcus epidermidis TaxID=1282 RepID=UPI0028CB89E5